MQSIVFSKIRNISDLAKNLSIEEAYLNKLLSTESQSLFYRKMNIPKKNKTLKQYRTVYKTIDMALSLVHKNLESAINIIETFPVYVQGFVRDRSIVTNAKRHLAKKYILNADIKNFFESIGLEKVIDSFTYIGCIPKIASVLAKLCTLDGILVQGLSTSPVLANIASRKMDKDLFNLGIRYDCEYTRYADDITFSGDESVPLKEEIEEIFNKHGFQLNHNKFKIQRRGKSQYVTGLTVFDKEHPRLPKKIKKNLRMRLYYATKYGLENHFKKVGIDIEDSYLVEGEIVKIDGWIGFMFCVEPKLANKFKEIWGKVLNDYYKTH